MGIGEMMIDRCRHCGEMIMLWRDATLNKDTCDGVSFKDDGFGPKDILLWEDAIYLRCLKCHPFPPENKKLSPMSDRFLLLDL